MVSPSQHRQRREVLRRPQIQAEEAAKPKRARRGKAAGADLPRPPKLTALDAGALGLEETGVPMNCELSGSK